MEITREKLYEMVWSDPMRVLAARHGVSDRGLAKMCERLEVPRPGRGYWAKKAAGHKVRKEPLKKASAGTDESASIVPREARSAGTLEPTGPVADQRAFEAREDNAIRVPERIGRYHPLVKQTRAILQRATKVPQILWKRHDYLDLHVDRKSERRALGIFDTLIKALERRGMSVRFDAKEKGTLVEVRDVTIQIRIEERYRQHELPITDRDRSRADMFGWLEPRPEKELVPTGRLALKILEGRASDLRKTWADGRKQRVEDCLNAFVVGLVAAAEAKKESRRRHAEWRRQWEEGQRLAELQRRREEEEKRRVERLQQQVEDWHKAQCIRRFLQAAREAWRDQVGTVSNAEIREWFSWAEGRAQQLDPLKKAPLQVACGYGIVSPP